MLASLGVFRVGTEKINRYAFGLAQYFLILQDLFHFWSEISDTYLKEKFSKNKIPIYLKLIDNFYLLRTLLLCTISDILCTHRANNN